MKDRWIACCVLFLLMILSSCQQSEEQQTTEDEVKAPRVEIMANEELKVGEEAKIAAKVYYGEELVDDAEVTFEIKADDSSEKSAAKLVDTGTYEISYTFKEAGTYKVIAHTNVKGIHTMPNKSIKVVGDKTAAEEMDHVSHEAEHQGDEHEEEESHHHSSVTISVDDLTGFQLKEEAKLKTTIEQGEQPFKEAKVQFEIAKEGAEVHQFIDAVESTTKGMYTASYTFDEPGKYRIVIHVQKGEVHDHIETSVEVQ